MSKIISSGTAVPQYKYAQDELFSFADRVYNRSEEDTRKLRFLYKKSGIGFRYSVIPDFNAKENKDSIFYANQSGPVADISQRMEIYNREAVTLSEVAINNCIKDRIEASDITHLITVSCTGMSAPGLDLQLMESMGLKKNIVRTSVNFMGCYAAVHAMKLADAFCRSDEKANVVIVCTELCTLHFQHEATVDNLTASLLFADGSAALLVQHDDAGPGLRITNFFSEVAFKGKQDMAWVLSKNGFLMTLSGYIPDIIRADFNGLVNDALEDAKINKDQIDHWCMHPGGNKILDSIAESINIDKKELQNSYNTLHDYGNMSSATIIFVLQKILQDLGSRKAENETVFGAAFGPGLTMETFTAVYD